MAGSNIPLSVPSSKIWMETSAEHNAARLKQYIFIDAVHAVNKVQ